MICSPIEVQQQELLTEQKLLYQIHNQLIYAIVVVLFSFGFVFFFCALQKRKGMRGRSINVLDE